MPEAELCGSYQRIDFVLDVKRLCEQPIPMELNADGSLKVADLTGTWSYNERTGWIEIVIGGAIEKLRALRATHREEGGATIAFTGRNDAGIGVWAVKHTKQPREKIAVRRFA